MEYPVIGIGIVLLGFLLQMHFRLKKIEMKLIELDMRLDTFERERAQASSQQNT